MKRVLILLMVIVVVIMACKLSRPNNIPEFTDEMNHAICIEEGIY